MMTTFKKNTTILRISTYFFSINVKYINFLSDYRTNKILELFVALSK